MIKNVKFMKTPLIPFMESVMQSHTKAYQADFDIDVEVLYAAADPAVTAQDKRYIWLCRTMGTWLLREREVFLTETRESNVLTFYREQTREPILAYAVEVIGKFGESIIGNIYTLDYGDYYAHVKSVSMPSQSVLMRYELGDIVKHATQFSGYSDEQFGRLKEYTFYPEDEAELRRLLSREKHIREQFGSADPAAYLAELESEVRVNAG